MDTSDISTKITIHIEDSVEHDYLVDVLLPTLFGRAIKPLITIDDNGCTIDTHLYPLGDGYNSYMHDPRGLLTVILVNLTVILKNYISLDYSDDLGFEIWFDVPKTIEENVTEA